MQKEQIQTGQVYLMKKHDLIIPVRIIHNCDSGRGWMGQDISEHYPSRFEIHSASMFIRKAVRIKGKHCAIKACDRLVVDAYEDCEQIHLCCAHWL